MTRHPLRIALVSLVATLTVVFGDAVPLTAERAPAFSVEVLVDGRPLPVHPHRGTRYIEATRGREYAIRLRNPLDVRVAVALSVDGLNSIDARRTTAVDARKWVIGPRETITISGWQLNQGEARRFYFTSEDDAYATRLGQDTNLGVISAVFFRERAAEPAPVTEAREAAPGAERSRSGVVGGAVPSAPAASSPSASADDYAATGIGRRTTHRVQQVWLDLEPTAVASVALRYEYRAQLVRLGVLTQVVDRATRRSRATGFEPGFCPEPPKREH